MRRAPIKSDLTAEYVRSLFLYDPESGIVSHKPRKGVRSLGRAGCVNSGYRRLKINQIPYQEHRVIWLMMTGEWPPNGMEPDHKNLDKTDNRWINLRLSTHSQNAHNAKPRVAGKLKGVFKNGKRYMAVIGIGGKQMYLGTYDTPEMAFSAYSEKLQSIAGEFARIA